MPRDLEPEKDKPSASASASASASTSTSTSPPITLTESPNSVATERSDSPHDANDSPLSTRTQFTIIPHDQQHPAPTTLHPYTRPLTISDLESVVALENASFSTVEERASREKLEYRLSKCGEICYGLFCTVVPGSGTSPATLSTGRPVETSRRNGAVSVLIGHVISAKTTMPVVTDEAMDYPKDWTSGSSGPSTLGHQEQGRTIAMHSVAILPEFQGRGLGRVLMLSYMQHMNGAGIADKLALIAHDHKTPWYEKLGFRNQGKSTTTFGGGGWFDMIFELKSLEARTAYG